MSSRSELLSALATLIADYRRGEIPEPTPDHIDRWIRQFDEEAQEPLLAELGYVFQRTYYSRNKVKDFLLKVATSKKFTGEDPVSFWQSTGLLNIQRSGASQRELLSLFNETLKTKFGLDRDQCLAASNRFIYLDDGIFSGASLRRDISHWLTTSAPKTSALRVVTIAEHAGGQYHAEQKILEAAKAAGKKIEISFHSLTKFEDRRAHTTQSDVLRPKSFPTDSRSNAYLKLLTDAGHRPINRSGDSIGAAKIFSSPAGRHLLEQQFFKAGLRVRERCPNLHDTHRPLGYTRLHTPGFGSMFVTYRNCPNSTPLALWVDAPWYPLFPRKTNAQTEVSAWL